MSSFSLLNSNPTQYVSNPGKIPINEAQQTNPNVNFIILQRENSLQSFAALGTKLTIPQEVDNIPQGVNNIPQEINSSLLFFSPNSNSAVTESFRQNDFVPPTPLRTEQVKEELTYYYNIVVVSGDFILAAGYLKEFLQSMPEDNRRQLFSGESYLVEQIITILTRLSQIEDNVGFETVYECLVILKEVQCHTLIIEKILLTLSCFKYIPRLQAMILPRMEKLKQLLGK
jgi:hypothetical protein